MKTILYPTAGYIANCQNNLLPGYQPNTFSEDKVEPLNGCEKNLLRDLAGKVKYLADLPEQEYKRDLWYKHCDLKQTKPMLLVFPEDSWTEIIPKDKIIIKHGFWAQIEWYLRHLIYRHENIKDDFVIEPVLYVDIAVGRSSWGVCPEFDKKESYSWEPPIKDEYDLEKLVIPDIVVEKELSDYRYNLVCQALGDILEVKQHCYLPLMLTCDTAALFLGIEQLMMHMYDKPRLVHRVMDTISDGFLKEAEYLQDNNLLTLNNFGHYIDSGGIAYTNDLPSNSNGRKVEFKDLWGFGVAQAATGISPAMHEEFILPYDLKLLKHCGLVSYGCCETYTSKFGMLKRNFPNLRRVSVSPWCDPEVAAEELEDKYIYSCKLNPSYVTEFDPDAIRKDVREKLETAKGCCLEIILKDVSSLHNDPFRLNKWIKIVSEEIGKIKS